MAYGDLDSMSRTRSRKSSIKEEQGRQKQEGDVHRDWCKDKGGPWGGKGLESPGLLLSEARKTTGVDGIVGKNRPKCCD